MLPSFLCGLLFDGPRENKMFVLFAIKMSLKLTQFNICAPIHNLQCLLLGVRYHFRHLLRQHSEEGTGTCLKGDIRNLLK